MADAYHYTECGLDNVYISGLDVCDDHAGAHTFHIPKVRLLHRAIAEAIVQAPGALSGQELRFLRTEMGLTQEGLAKKVHVKRLTITRWENGDSTIDPNADGFVRMLAIEVLDLNVDLSAQSIWALIGGQPADHHITVDGRDPNHYRALAA